MTNPIVMTPWQLDRVTGAIRAVVDDMIAHSLIVLDRSQGQASVDVGRDD